MTSRYCTLVEWTKTKRMLREEDLNRASESLDDRNPQWPTLLNYVSDPSVLSDRAVDFLVNWFLAMVCEFQKWTSPRVGCVRGSLANKVACLLKSMSPRISRRYGPLSV